MIRTVPAKPQCDKPFDIALKKRMRVRDVSLVSVFLLILVAALPLEAQFPLSSVSGSERTAASPDLWRGFQSFNARPNAQSEPLLMGRIDTSEASPDQANEPACSLSITGTCSQTERSSSALGAQQQVTSSGAPQSPSDAKTDPPDTSVKSSSALIGLNHQRADRNLDIYYRNRREFSLDVGWHPVNIPFIYDFAVGDSYNMTPLKYTLVPIIASLRWHVTNVGWRWIFRGNMDFTFSGSITAIPRGPETHYYSFDFGIRRNFVYRNWKVVPFFEQRGGAGIINAKEPMGVLFAQGQNLTFTYNMGVGVRYNIDSKYSFSAGMNYMHISNGYLSEPQFNNYGINVYGPMFGMDVRLGKPHHASE